MDSISNTTDCFYFDRGSDLFSEIFDVGIDSSIVDILIIADNILHERFALDDTFTILHKVFK